jgi:hypothetical protein
VTASTTLTPGRRRALAVLLAGDRQGHGARYSNATTDPDHVETEAQQRSLAVYWQTANWLETHGLIQPRHGGTTVLRLTSYGRHVAQRLSERDAP